MGATPRLCELVVAASILLIPLAAQAQGAGLRSSSQWHLQSGALSRHFTQTQADGHEWNNNHPGIGLEYRLNTRSTWGTRLTAGFLRDSRNYPSGYAGVGYMRQFNVNGGVTMAAGLGAYLFYRSRSWDGDMAYVPALLPTLQFGFFRNRLGVNVLAVPKLEAFGHSTSPLVLALFTFRYD